MRDTLIPEQVQKILIVCMGNICRSPTGEAVLKHKLAKAGLKHIEVYSAGTIAYHQGNPPDRRSIAAGRKRGYSFDGMYARQVTPQDFEYFDLILAADKANLADLMALCPAQYQHKLKLFLQFGRSHYLEIPDPYYGEGDGFELVLELIEEAATSLIKQLQKR
ncbi:low molecular weight protein-tyrosine-phosphatase [Pseudoalteromonas sp. S16_S37]|uniref:low molecular weight protein-tyrosine-phosphatase n=1 Tax=Pseudoalteromonas sp. S16_S37 TaxID=2720228 RepID=UPI001680C06C|nr:low molecular weight protein-tyrosine-phosphatase [Pseudoalteromonas sp. S16_S37]MBD1584628.1 low molecular weight phosphotyrosine protein phosphatase [Pseudoalteromonas sp. S16_S37]